MHVFFVDFFLGFVSDITVEATDSGDDCSRKVAYLRDDSDTAAAVVDGTTGEDGISFFDTCSFTSSPIKTCILLSDKFSIPNDSDNKEQLLSLVLFLVCSN